MISVRKMGAVMRILIGAAAIVVGLIPVQSSVAASKPHKHKPDFSLILSTDNVVVESHKDMDIEIDVKETNVSHHKVNVGRLVEEPGAWYSMRVLLNGRPVPTTAVYRDMLAPKKPDPNAPVEFNPIPGVLPPRKSKTFEIPLSRYFDMSTPGTYEITFWRGTDEGQADNLDVQSNTISITVIPNNNRGEQR